MTLELAPLPWSLEPYGRYLLLLARTRLHRRLRSKLEPSDIVEETLLRALARQEQCRGQTERERAAWLRTILTNTITEQLRKFHGPQRDVALERPLDADLSLLLIDASPAQHAAEREQTHRLAAGLDQLPAEQRTALELHYLERLTVPEVARWMDRTTAAVTSSGSTTRRPTGAGSSMLPPGTTRSSPRRATKASRTAWTSSPW